MKKKLSKAARKKESTGINIEAAKKRESKLEKRISALEFKLECLIHILHESAIGSKPKKKGKKK